MSEPAEIKWYWAIATGILGIASSLFGAGIWFNKQIEKIVKLEKRQADTESNLIELTSIIAKMDADIRRRLYQPDGKLIYLPADQWMKESEKCRNELRQDIKEVKAGLKELINLHMKE